MQTSSPLLPANPRRLRIRRAIFASIGFHVVLVILLLAWYFPVNRETAARTSATDEAVASSIEDRSAPMIEAARVPPPQIDSSIRSSIENAALVSDQRKLSELEKNVRRLDQITSDQSIAEIGKVVQSATGLAPRAGVPSDGPVAGEFDFDSAQFHDVTRQTDSTGQWVYRSVLVDAEGRTLEVELGAEEGKTAYDTMSMVKQSPFAETIYRTMVMPMIDKLIPRPGVPPVEESPSRSVTAPSGESLP